MPVVEAPSRISIRSILVATDFSEVSQASLPFAAAMARRFGARVFVAHVIPPPAQLALPLEALPAEYDLERIAAMQHMREFLASGALLGVPHEPVLEKGPFWDVLAEIKRKRDIDLIVLGTHGRRGVKRMLLGSVAEEILRGAECPVLAVGPEVIPKVVPGDAWQQIIYATDFMPGSLKALEYALELVRGSAGQLTFLHVIDVPQDATLEDSRDQRLEAFRRLRPLLPTDAGLARTPEFLVQVGKPAEIVLRVAADRRADLIVMGAQQVAHTSLASHFGSDTVHGVLVHAKCPVLTVRS